MRYNENVDYPFGPFRIALMVWNTQGKSAGIDSVALGATYLLVASAALF